MIKEVLIEDINKFYDLMAEIEVGNHFDFDNPKHVDWLKRKINVRFSEGTRFYAFYLEDGTPVGIAGLLINESLFCPNNSELKDIGIYPQFRRKGYGSELLKYTEELSRKASVYCMYMYTYAAEWQTIAYYGKNGFVPIANLPDVHGPGNEGHIYLRKVLK